ncbi:MAG TPA: hypothetical protein VF158_15955 [Longimicrobiales bacterium]
MSWAAENRAWRERARERWAPASPEHLRLRAWLAAPVAWDLYDPLMIEGALQYAVVVRETGRMPDDVFAGCPLDAPLEDTDIQIPIADSEVPGCPIPIALASAGWPSADATASVRWRRRRVRAEKLGATIVNASVGETKATNLPAPVVIAYWIDWWVMGDRRLLEDLLRDVHTIGGKRSGGLGQVQGWEIAPANPWSWFGPGGRLMRPLPAHFELARRSSRHDIREGTVRAPYWHPRTRMLCCVPIQRVGESIDAAREGADVS